MSSKERNRHTPPRKMVQSQAVPESKEVIPMQGIDWTMVVGMVLLAIPKAIALFYLCYMQGKSAPSDRG